MAHRARQGAPAEQSTSLEARVVDAPCVPAIRAEGGATGADGGYKGASDTTRVPARTIGSTLITGCPTAAEFKYHSFQQEAIETLIYLYEVAEVRRHKGWSRRFATAQDLRRLHRRLRPLLQ